MEMRFNLPLQIGLGDAELGDYAHVTVQVIYEGARWRGQCQDPPICTHYCETIEEVLVATMKQVRQDAAAQSVE